MMPILEKSCFSYFCTVHKLSDQNVSFDNKTTFTCYGHVSDTLNLNIQKVHSIKAHENLLKDYLFIMQQMAHM